MSAIRLPLLRKSPVPSDIESTAAQSGWPPIAYWCLPALVSLLRIGPFLWSFCLQPPAGKSVVCVGFAPSDFLQYVAMIRQAAATGSIFLHDPFTTETHEPRFILLFHWALGIFSRATGCGADWTLELSRIPIIFVFFAVLWWFLSPILPDRKDRLWATALVGLSGGIEGFLKPLTAFVPESISEPFIQSTWHMYGWNTFEAMFNPLWIAGLIVTLVVLRPVLDPKGPQTKSHFVMITLGFLVLFFVHPYSAIVALTVIGALPVAEWIFGQVQWKIHLKIAAAIVGPVILIALVSRWQSQDLIYRAAAGNVFGAFQLEVSWYPLTFAALGVAALRGARTWVSEAHPYRLALLAWIAAVIVLHTSPVINGYHFTFHLHLPLCILAAPAVRAIGDQLRSESRSRVFAYTWMIALFVSSVLVTGESVGDIKRRNLRPAEFPAVIHALTSLPPGNAFTSFELGNLVPAYTDHRVWLGHWFMTPNKLERIHQFRAIVAGDPKALDELEAIVDEQRIDYIVIPVDAASAIADRLGDRVYSRQTHESLELLILARTAN